MANVSNDLIYVSFAWTGPSSHVPNHRSLEVRNIDIFFHNSITRVKVNIPQYLSPRQFHKLPFTCYKGDSVTEHHSLSVKASEISRAIINAGFFQESLHKESWIRTDEKIALRLPQNLESGQKYKLEITSNNLELSAALIKEENSVLSFLSEAIIPLQKKTFESFESKISFFIGKIVYAYETNVEFICKNEIQNELANTDQILIDTQNAQEACLKLFGEVRLMNMMRRCIEARFLGEIPCELHHIINSAAKDFLKFFIQHDGIQVIC